MHIGTQQPWCCSWLAEGHGPVASWVTGVSMAATISPTSPTQMLSSGCNRYDQPHDPCVPVSDALTAHGHQGLRMPPLTEHVGCHAGWCNMIGQFAITAGIAATFMGIAATMYLLATGSQLSTVEQLSIYGGTPSPDRPHVSLHACAPPPPPHPTEIACNCWSE